MFLIFNYNLVIIINIHIFVIKYKTMDSYKKLAKLEKTYIRNTEAYNRKYHSVKTGVEKRITSFLKNITKDNYIVKLFTNEHNLESMTLNLERKDTNIHTEFVLSFSFSNKGFTHSKFHIDNLTISNGKNFTHDYVQFISKFSKSYEKEDFFYRFMVDSYIAVSHAKYKKEDSKAIYENFKEDVRERLYQEIIENIKKSLKKSQIYKIDNKIIYINDVYEDTISIQYYVEDHTVRESLFGDQHKYLHTLYNESVKSKLFAISIYDNVPDRVRKITEVTGDVEGVIEYHQKNANNKEE